MTFLNICISQRNRKIILANIFLSFPTWINLWSIQSRKLILLSIAKNISYVVIAFELSPNLFLEVSISLLETSFCIAFSDKFFFYCTLNNLLCLIINSIYYACRMARSWKKKFSFFCGERRNAINVTWLFWIVFFPFLS